MDFLKKFFENIYLFVVDTIRDFVGGIFLLFRYPFIGPHLMLRRHRLEQRNGIDPSLFLFLASVAILVVIFADFGNRITLTLERWNNQDSLLGDDDIVELFSSGKPNARLNLLIVSGFVMSLLVGLIIGTVTNCRRITLFSRKNRPLRLRNLTKTEKLRLPAAYYAAVLAMVAGFATMMLIVFYGPFQTAYVFVAEQIIYPVGNIDLFEFGNGLMFTTGDIALTLAIVLFTVPANMPLARVIFWPEIGIRTFPKLIKWIGASSLTSLLMLIPISGAITTFLWLSNVAKPEEPIDQPPKTFAVLQRSCDLPEWPYLNVSFYYINETDSRVIFPQESFFVTLKGKPLDVDGKALADRNTLIQELPLRVQSVGTVSRGTSFVLEPETEGLISMEANHEFSFEVPLGTESWSDMECTITHDQALVWAPEDLLPKEIFARVLRMPIR